MDNYNPTLRLVAQSVNYVVSNVSPRQTSKPIFLRETKHTNLRCLFVKACGINKLPLSKAFSPSYTGNLQDVHWC